MAARDLPIMLSNIERIPGFRIVESYGIATGNTVREAILRRIDDARGRGCDAVINARLETSRLANQTQGEGERLAGIEMLAYGTGLSLRRRPR